LGYKQQTNFTRRFKRLYGICPSKQPPETPISPRMREND
jgi:AraC-like DNA-binding protein